MKLEDYLKKEKISYKSAAKALGLNRSTLYRIIRGIGNPTYSTAYAISEYTSGQVSVEDVMSQRVEKVRCPSCGKLCREELLNKIRSTDM